MDQTGGQKRERDLDEAVEAEFFKHPSMKHRSRTWRGAVTERGPGVERPEGNEDAEAKSEETKDVVLYRGLERLGGDHAAEFDKIEAVGAAFNIEGDQADERKHRAKREVDRQLHGRVVAVAATPDTDHDKRRDEGEFVEEIEEEDIHAGEDAH